MENSLLSVQDLRVYFRGNEKVARAVDGVDFDVEKGETVCIVGESGCGKTVSTLAILGLILSFIFAGAEIALLSSNRLQLPTLLRVQR